MGGSQARVGDIHAGGAHVATAALMNKMAIPSGVIDPIDHVASDAETDKMADAAWGDARPAAGRVGGTTWQGDATLLAGKLGPDRELVTEAVGGLVTTDLCQSNAIGIDFDFVENNRVTVAHNRDADVVSGIISDVSCIFDVCVSGKPGCTAGPIGAHHVAIRNRNDDWFRVLSPGAERSNCTDLYCVLWVADRNGRHTWSEMYIDIYDDCLLGICNCVHCIDGARAQIRPCRVYVECFHRGDLDPDWEFILRGACFGYKVIDEQCDSTYNRGNYGSITKGEVGLVMSGRLQAEIEEEMVTIVDEPCACIHALGGVPKGHDDFRAIVDCSSPVGTCVNDHTTSCRSKFSYNSVESVTAVLREGDYMATVDISNAYRAISIYPACRERQGLAWDFGSGTVFLRDNRLCMGLSSSPYVFSKFSDFVVRCMVRQGYDECINYLDDFCVIGRDAGRCAEAQCMLVCILRRLGFYVSFKKLSSPACVTRFLGIDIDSIKMELRLPEDKLIKLRLQLKHFMRRRKARKRELESLAGVLAHCCKVIHGGRTFSRRVYDLIASVKKRDHKIRLNDEFRLDLRWWLEFSANFNGRARIIQPRQSVLAVYSDASLFGFGATHNADWLAGCFKFSDERELQGWLGHHFVGSADSGCRTENINVLELWPVLAGVRRWGHLWSDRTVVFITDNTQVLAAINSGRSKNKTSMAWLRLIFWASVKHNFDIQSVYINTRDNIVCDSLSRLGAFKNIARIRDADTAGLMCCHHMFFV